MPWTYFWRGRDVEVRTELMDKDDLNDYRSQIRSLKKLQRSINEKCLNLMFALPLIYQKRKSKFSAMRTWSDAQWIVNKKRSISATAETHNTLKPPMEVNAFGVRSWRTFFVQLLPNHDPCHNVDLSVVAFG